MWSATATVPRSRSSLYFCEQSCRRDRGQAGALGGGAAARRSGRSVKRNPNRPPSSLASARTGSATYSVRSNGPSLSTDERKSEFIVTMYWNPNWLARRAPMVRHDATWPGLTVGGVDVDHTGAGHGWSAEWTRSSTTAKRARAHAATTPRRRLSAVMVRRCRCCSTSTHAARAAVITSETPTITVRRLRVPRLTDPRRRTRIRYMP